MHRHPSQLRHNTDRTFAQRAADAVAAGMGSWTFIIAQSIVVAAWVLANSVELFFRPFDLYPFILLNLLFSTQAAYAAPVIMMSQNRQAATDRAHAENAYHHIDEVNQKQDAQLEILQQQNDLALEQHSEILDLLKSNHHPPPPARGY